MSLILDLGKGPSQAKPPSGFVPSIHPQHSTLVFAAFIVTEKLLEDRSVIPNCDKPVTQPNVGDSRNRM